MITNVLLIGGGFLMGLVCLGFTIITIFYLAYCVVAGYLEKREYAAPYSAPRLKGDQ